jgi:hypothetical protein
MGKNCLLCSLVVTVCTSVGTGQESRVRSRADLLALIESERKQFGDIEARFRGSMRDGAPDLRSKPVPTLKCEGLWRYRADGKQWAEFTETVGDAASRNKTVSTSERSETVLAGGRAVIRENQLWEMAMGGKPGMLFALVTLADVWWPFLERSAEVKGLERVDGRQCLSFTFDARPISPDGSGQVGSSRIAHVWLDLERGAHVVRWEYAEPDKGDGPTSRTTYHLARHGEFWVPKSSRKEGYLLPGGKLLKRPAILEEVAIDLSTLKINRGLADEQLAVQLQAGTLVDDQLQGKEYYVGGSPPGRPSVDAKRQLDGFANRAQLQAEGVRASYGKTSAWWWVAIVLCTSGVALGALAFILRRTAR